MVAITGENPMGYSLSSVEAQNRLLQDNDDEALVEGTTKVRTNISRHVPTTPPHAGSSLLTLPKHETPPRPPGSVLGGFGLPKLATIWSAPSSGITTVQNVEFTIMQRAFESHLRFLVVDRPPRLAPYITEEEWVELRNKMDEIGKRVRWDVNRSLVLVVIVFVMVVIVNLGDEIGGSFSLGGGQESILIVLGIILLKLIFDECWENCTRRHVLHEMDEVCREYSNMMRPRGVCVAFRFEDCDDHGLLVDLIFYRVWTKENMIPEIS
jgi:hypothetical protein